MSLQMGPVCLRSQGRFEEPFIRPWTEMHMSEVDHVYSNQSVD